MGRDKAVQNWKFSEEVQLGEDYGSGYPAGLVESFSISVFVTLIFICPSCLQTLCVYVSM